MTKATYNPSTAKLGKCQGSVEELYRYIDGNLEGADLIRFRQHLDACETCVDVHDFQLKLKQFVGERCRAAMPDSVRERVLKALEAECGED